MEDEKRGHPSLKETERGDPEVSSGTRVSLLIHHRDGSKVVTLEPGRPIVIGRSRPSDVIVDDSKLSRRHVQVTLGYEGCTVEDLGSTNGTFHNGERIEGSMRFKVGDELLAGTLTIVLNVLQSRECSDLAVDGYDRFLENLEQEVMRGRVFGRPLSLLMLRAIAREPLAVVPIFLPYVRAKLRPVDLVGLYGVGHLLVALPETSLEKAGALARQLLSSMPPGTPPVVVGVAAFPSTATSADELLSAARTSAIEATIDEPLRGIGSTERETQQSRIVAVSPAMQRLFEMLDRVAPTTAPVLVLGETGAGKEIVARTVHDRSPRHAGPFLALNCGAVPSTLIESTFFGHEKGSFTGAEQRREGLFEQAAEGTIFLDEVGELSGAMQASLLRVLDTKRIRRVGSPREIEVNVRVVAATNRDLEEMVEDGSFRQDLLYRLNTITLEVPPLRDRPEDIEALAEIFAEESARENGLPPRKLSDKARECVLAYRWPGNVRELRNAMARAVVIASGDAIVAEDLPRRVQRGGDDRGGKSSPFDDGVAFKERVIQYEMELMEEALRRTGGNHTHAARLLRIPIRTFLYKLKSYGL